MGHQHYMSASYIPGDDDFYMPASAPELVAPEPQRFNPEMSNQIAEGIQHMDLNNSNNHHPRAATMSPPHQLSNNYSTLPIVHDPAAGLSPFPKLANHPPNVPLSNDELESRLEAARNAVLNSNDPEMQLAWAQDVLTYCGVCADDAERLAAAKPQMPRTATPKIEHQLKVDAMSIVNFLADQRHPKAEFLRGMWLEWGRFGQREDKKEAFRCYSRAADRGYARAEYRIGMLYESYNDPIKALRHYHRGVDAGDAASCYRLGMMTLRGQHGQQQDFAKGIDLIRRSAEGADENAAQGAYVYGMLLARQLPQIDVPDGYLQFDERLAKENIEKAAYMKFAKAQAKMGSTYELGALGCDFDPALSIHYNALASKQGEADADMALSKWFLVGFEGLFPKNEELAYTYAERAAQSGLPTAEFALGYFHEIGMYVPVNLDKALEWYDKAAKHGNEDAKGRVDGLAKKQVLSRMDHEKVAVSRIKSQHGSMRGGRPERFQQQAPQLNRVDESPAYTSPVYSPAPYNNGNANAVQPPQRNSSTTPYPLDNGPPVVTPVNRPTSSTPYPLADGPPSISGSQYSTPRLGLGPAGGFLNAQPPDQRPMSAMEAQMRPSSAFQINPDLRPNSVATGMQGSYGAPRPYPGGVALGPPGPATRPATAQPYDPRARPAATRIASGPAGMQNFRPQPGPPLPVKPLHPATAPVNPQARPQQAQAPQGRVNLGFSAPLEERKPIVDPTYQSPSLKHARPVQPQQPKPAAQSPHPHPLSSSSRPGTTVVPPRTDSARPLQPAQQRTSTAPNPPQKDAAPKTSGTPKPVGAASLSSAPARPPGKGPKTFEEMGVPSHKQDSDCIIM